MATLPLDLQTNPLINPPKLRHDAYPFDLVRTEHFLPAIEYGIAAHRAEIEAIKNNPEPPTFGNTIAALEFSGEILDRAASVFDVISGTKSDKEIQKLEKAIGVKLAAHGNDIGLDEALFARIKAVRDSSESEYLGEQEKRVLEKKYRGYVRSGALLSPDKKERLRAIDSRLSELGTKFGNNIKESKNAFRLVVDVADLQGVPADIVDALYKAAQKEGLEGKAILKLDSTAYAIIEYAHNRDLRMEIAKGLGNVANNGRTDNRPVIMEFVKLRHERANLLGYKTHAHYVLDNRMAKTPETVMAFLEKNLDGYKPAAQSYMRELQAFARERDGIEELKSWDTAYYKTLLAEKKYGLDMQKIRPYFTLDNIVKGFHDHLGKAFGVELVETPYPVHKSGVRVYEAFNKASGNFIGLFYANYAEDHNPKSAKRDGAWMNQLRSRAVQNGRIIAPLITNDCNYKPQKEGEIPTLLTTDEDSTVRHEGGHGMHGMLTTARYPSISGANVKWDWVEVPSQLQENWGAQKEVLKTYARHYETGKTIPDELVDKLLAAKNFGSGMAGLRQTRFGLLDMKWHLTNPDDLKSVEDVEREINAISAVVDGPEGATTSTSFSHIFSGGYSSGYYSYKWAEVIEADIFSLFEKNGLYHQPSLDAVRKCVYESGDIRDPDDLFRDLMGRDPDPEALFRREGLAPAHKEKLCRAISPEYKLTP